MKEECFPPRSEARQKDVLTISPSQCNEEENKIKGIQIGKEKIRLSLFEDGIVVYIENPKGSTKKLLELMNSARLLKKKNQSHFYVSINTWTPRLKTQYYL